MTDTSNLAQLEKVARDLEFVATRIGQPGCARRLEAADDLAAVRWAIGRIEMLHLFVGRAVEIAPDYRYAADWRGQELWIASLQVQPATGKLMVGVTDHWPPRHNGDITDEFEPEHVRPRAVSDG